MSEDKSKLLYCGFCGKSQETVKKLIAGPTTFICDECVRLCMSIIDDAERKAPGKDSQPLAPD